LSWRPIDANAVKRLNPTRHIFSKKPVFICQHYICTQGFLKI
jgi:hypothetical protein